MKCMNWIAGLFLLLAYSGFSDNSFLDDKTGHRLSIKSGTEEDFLWAKNFCLEFFNPVYAEIPLDEDQRAYGSYKAFIDAKFSDHKTGIFNENRYRFFIVEDLDDNKYIGYTIIDINNEKVYSLETQSDIKSYSVKSLMVGLSHYVKENVAPRAEYFISAVRKSMPQFVGVLESCDFTPADDTWLHTTLKPEYYCALVRGL